jgi:thiopurine S-methyltransferase
MEKDFWIQKWGKKDIGFHQKEVNAHLKTNLEKLSLKKGDRVFLPLCGKTLDIAWLLSQGYRVVGAELVETAIQELFSELKIKPQIIQINNFKHYFAENIDIFVGDIFELTKEILGSVDAVYDRAALVALPEMLREKYTMHLLQITDRAPQLLVVYEYNQSEMPGPPFSIKEEEVRQHYANSYQIKRIASIDVPGGMKGQIPAKENVWLLEKR